MSATVANDENARPGEGAVAGPSDFDRARFGFKKRAPLRPATGGDLNASPSKESSGLPFAAIPSPARSCSARSTPAAAFPPPSHEAEAAAELAAALVPPLPLPGGTEASTPALSAREAAPEAEAVPAPAPAAPPGDLDIVALLDEELGDPEAPLSVLKLKPKAGRFDFKEQIAELKSVVAPLREALGERLRREAALREAVVAAQAEVARRLAAVDARLAEQRRAQEERLEQVAQQHARELRVWQAKEADAERARVDRELAQERAFAERDRQNRHLHEVATADLERQLQAAREECTKQVNEASALLQSQIEESNRVTRDIREAARQCEESLVAEWTARLEEASQQAAEREGALRRGAEEATAAARRREAELLEAHGAALAAARGEAEAREAELLRRAADDASAAQRREEDLREASAQALAAARAEAAAAEAEERARRAAEEHEAALAAAEAEAERSAAEAAAAAAESVRDRDAQLEELRKGAQQREEALMSEAAEARARHAAEAADSRADAEARQRASAAEAAERLQQAQAQAQERLVASQAEAAEQVAQRDARLREVEEQAAARERGLVAEAAERLREARAQLQELEARREAREREVAAEAAERLSAHGAALKELGAKAQQREREMAAEAAEQLGEAELRARQREHELTLRLEQQAFRAQQAASELQMELEASAAAARNREEALRAELKEAVTRCRQVNGELSAAEDRLGARERRFQEDLGEALGRARRLETELAAERSARDREALAKSTLQTEHCGLVGVVERQRGTLQEVQAQLEACKERNAELQRELSGAEAECERLREAVAEEQANLQRCREDAERLGAQLAGTREELASTSAELGCIREKSRRLSTDRRELELEYRSYREHNSTSNQAQMQAITELKVTVDKLTQKVEATQTELVAKSGDVAQHQQFIRNLEEQLAHAESSRRELHNTIQELRGNIRVFCRVRPGLDSSASSLTQGEDGKISVSHGGESYAFAYDKVFGPASQQEELFAEVSGLVQSALDGYKVCIFAYGQTGSGKTFTMQGGEAPSSWGLIPRSLRQIFQSAELMLAKGWQWSLRASFMEVYNEVLRDLLREDGGKAGGSSTPQCHTIKHDADWGTVVTNMTCVQVASMEQINSLMARAAKLRAVGSTDMNSVSSRSHSIFALYLSGSNPELGQELRGALHLVDLAGSERLDRSGAVGDRLKETQNINRSLSSLVDVFAAKAEARSHVPFRNSKLTHLMEPCLSGQGKTLMAVNVGPEANNSHETLCSLRFASQVSQCTTGGKPRRSAKAIIRPGSATVPPAAAGRRGAP